MVADMGKKTDTLKPHVSAYGPGPWTAKVGKAGEGHQETGDMAGEADRIQDVQGLQTMLKILDLFQGASMRGRSWMSGLCRIACHSLEWKLRLRLLWSMLGMMGPGQGKDGRARTPCWEREPSNRDGREGEGEK